MWEHVPRWRVGNADPPAAGSSSGLELLYQLLYQLLCARSGFYLHNFFGWPGFGVWTYTDFSGGGALLATQTFGAFVGRIQRKHCEFEI